MKITKISVKGLFGIFDHEISLNTKEKITIIHGLNGFGKTNILRILNGLINHKYSRFINIPFNKFKVLFDNNNVLEIQKDLTSKKELVEEQVLLNFYINDKIISSYVVRKDNQNIKSGVSKSIHQEPQWLNNIRSNINTKLIESQRLLHIDTREISKVSTYSKELAEIMQKKFSEYTQKSYLLDESFPVRVLQQQNVTRLTSEKLNIKLDKLENIYTQLTNLGLLNKDENTDFSIQLENVNKSTQIYLSIFAEDVKQKYLTFDKIAKKIDLLRTIINRKFACSYKKINFNKDQGFVFTTCYPGSSESKIISPTDLSSGEQQELVLLYELLFKVEPNSLVLIDEPEKSLHIEWQSQFLEDLKEVTKLADLNILMATNSPDIIQDRWDDLAVELNAPVA